MSPTRASWNAKIARYFADDNTSAEYKYDFGDGWRHSVIFEEVLPRVEGLRYPICVAGRRACPLQVVRIRRTRTGARKVRHLGEGSPWRTD